MRKIANIRGNPLFDYHFNQTTCIMKYQPTFAKQKTRVNIALTHSGILVCSYAKAQKKTNRILITPTYRMCCFPLITWRPTCKLKHKREAYEQYVIMSLWPLKPAPFQSPYRNRPCEIVPKCPLAIKCAPYRNSLCEALHTSSTVLGIPFRLGKMLNEIQSD